MKRTGKYLAAITLIICCFACSLVFSACGESHEWDTEYSYDSTFHWYACKTCDDIKEQALHEVPVHGFNECTVCKQSLGVTYEISSDGTYASVIDYDNVANKVRIAKEYQGLPVKVICDNAFGESFSLTTVVIPESVTTIEDQTFRWCYKLTEVINRSPSVTVEKGAETNGYLGYRALSVFNSDDEYQSEFTDDNGYIVFTDGTEKILVNYTGTESKLTIPNYITQIHPNALDGLTILSVTIPDGVKTIGEYAFMHCKYLTNVVVPDSVASIGKGAFRFCYDLKTVKLGSGVKSIGNFAFDQCISLTEINLPEGITTIGDQTFLSCESLTFIKIPDSVKTVCNGAFSFCENLTSILIGNGVATIEYGAFYKSENLQTIFYNGTQEDYLNVTVDEDNNTSYLNATIYFFNDDPSQTDRNYWYLDSNGLPVIRTNQE